jgi:membrane protease subunit (stomatin/prohibitin family)
MGFWDKIFGEFVDVIEWLDHSSDTMVYRFERYGNEIKYGAKLTVREAQQAIFISEGRIADLFAPGMYSLETANLPILSTLQGWPHGFQSPFKAEVYFFNTRRFVDLKWGTKNPVMLRDEEFGPVRLRAFGTYVVKVTDPVTFLKEVVGTDGHFTTGEITNQLRNLIVSRFAAILGEAHIPILELAANYDDLSTFVTNRIAGEFGEYGLQISRLLVENISLPAEVEKVLDKRTSMGLLGNLRDYSVYQAAEAMTAAAANQGGGAAEGLGLGVGLAMGQKMSEALKGPAAPAAWPPPVPEQRNYYVAVEGRQTGPFTREEIVDKISKKAVRRETLLWRTGLENWQAAVELPDLDEAFARIPPPLPGVQG